MKPKETGVTVLIAGCGQLGSRHLQAVATLPEVSRIEVYDPREEGLNLGRARLDELPDRVVADVRWLRSLDEASSHGDLCIVATQAETRTAAVREVAGRLAYQKFLLEKIVARSNSEYESLLTFAAAQGLDVWVNCKSRAHDSHRRMKSRLDPSQPFVFTCQGGNHGLANNGVHAVDLFAFFEGCSSMELVSDQVDPILHPSKRGATVYDLSGIISGRSSRGSYFMVSFAGHHLGPAHFTLTSPTYRAVADDMMKWFVESSPESDWKWVAFPFDANLAVSFMTRAFVRDILASNRCELPTLAECYPAHQFILSTLQPHFDALIGKPLGFCPVT